MTAGAARAREPRRVWPMALLGAGALALALAASGCADMAYLGQAARGHWQLMQAARPVDAWLADPALAPERRMQLERAQALRTFAVRELALPDGASYTRFAELPHRAAVWNVTAAPALSLTLKTWCYPVMGCVGYRGYYDEGEARALGQRLQAEGWDVNVYGVPAYSTLGWGEWLGGDPLLSTFIAWPAADLAQILFHELAHQRVYLAGDMAFNESFATAVEQLGLARWAERGGADAQAAWRAAQRVQQRRREAQALAAGARSQLAALYASAASDADKRAGKAAILARLRADHAALKAGPWQGDASWDGFFARANNAVLALQGSYLDDVPAFEQLWLESAPGPAVPAAPREGMGKVAKPHLLMSGGDFAAFYVAVERLAARPAEERRAQLNALGARAGHSATGHAAQGPTAPRLSAASAPAPGAAALPSAPLH